MALKIELKAGERFILGNSVITNGKQRAQLFIDGDAPILREKDILMPEDADTPSKRIYLTVQAMYLSPEPQNYHQDYFALIKDMQQAAPSTMGIIDAINNEILTGSVYKALKKTKLLIDYEKELLEHAKRGSELRSDGEDDRKSA